GAKAVNYVKRFQSHGVRDVRDLYILEQRGIGFSDDYCPLYAGRNPGADNVDTREKFDDAALAAVEDCFARAKANGVDLSGYSTIENARDVEALRRGLKHDQWNVWGISYGSILGQAYLKQDPEGVRAAVIDAIVPLYPGTTLHNTTKYYARDLDLLAEACNANETCAKHFSDFRERLKTGIEAVSATPIAVEAIDTEDHPSGTAWFFSNLIGGAPFGLFYEQSNYPSMPAFIDALMDAVEKRDADTFRILSAGGASLGGGSTGMFNAIACRDGWIGQSKAASLEDMAAYPTLSKVLVGTLTSPPRLIDEHLKICKRYGAGPRPASDYLPVETDIRTLLVEGAMDPITPPPLAKEILPGFKNGTYVEFAYAGHGPSRSVDCAGDFLTSFFDDPDGALDLSCPESMEAPDFIGPLYPTNAFAKFGALAAEDEKQLMAPGLWFGLSAIILVFGALIYNLAPVARFINRNHALPTGGARVLAWATSLAGAASVIGLAAAAYMTNEANPFLFLVGLVGWAHWFIGAGLVAGLGGLALIIFTIRARTREALPIGVLLGLLLTGLSGIGLASFYAANGFVPILG
ncbi:MAG: alpha/beta fold hydrolase, partial [Pseudomonadota bacterium]